MSQDLRKAAQRVLRAQAEGRTPSLADHFTLGTVGELDPWFEKRAAYPFQNPPREPSVSDTAPRTTRPRPVTPATPQVHPPEPQAAPSSAPADPPAPEDEGPVPGSPEAVLAVRAMLSNPGMTMAEARGIAREAVSYLQRSRA